MKWENNTAYFETDQMSKVNCILYKKKSYGTDAMNIKHKSDQFKWLFERLKIHFLEQVGCIAINGQRKVFLSRISGMLGSGV